MIKEEGTKIEKVLDYLARQHTKLFESKADLTNEDTELKATTYALSTKRLDDVEAVLRLMIRQLTDEQRNIRYKIKRGFKIEEDDNGVCYISIRLISVPK